MLATAEGAGDRTDTFQPAVNSLRRACWSRKYARRIFPAHPDRPAAKHLDGGRLAGALARSRDKASDGAAPTSDSRPRPNTDPDPALLLDALALDLGTPRWQRSPLDTDADAPAPWSRQGFTWHDAWALVRGLRVGLEAAAIRAWGILRPQAEVGGADAGQSGANGSPRPRPVTVERLPVFFRRERKQTSAHGARAAASAGHWNQMRPAARNALAKLRRRPAPSR